MGEHVPPSPIDRRPCYNYVNIFKVMWRDFLILGSEYERPHCLANHRLCPAVCQCRPPVVSGLFLVGPAGGKWPRGTRRVLSRQTTSHVSRLTSHVSRLTSHVSRLTPEHLQLYLPDNLLTRCVRIYDTHVRQSRRGLSRT